ncbi:hypothetical protein BJX63DRAFT_7420 [Aspergillus granulosus]|uniref:Uncharacterized protein n=1 Tax=Aspergillus granulosus TaxID=176169 RepID=A0ABR4I5V3_9EURO
MRSGCLGALACSRSDNIVICLSDDNVKRPEIERTADRASTAAEGCRPRKFHECEPATRTYFGRWGGFEGLTVPGFRISAERACPPRCCSARGAALVLIYRPDDPGGHLTQVMLCYHFVIKVAIAVAIDLSAVHQGIAFRPPTVSQTLGRGATAVPLNEPAV